MKGRLITFEGGEGAGKSSLIKLLHEALVQKGFKVLLTREPGGSIGAERIRKLIVEKNEPDFDALTELLLLMSARRDHWIHTLRPALEEGKIILCDRFIDSSFVYQGYVGGVDLAFIKTAYEIVVEGCVYPDKTYYIDLDPKVGLSRVLTRSNQTQNNETRFEQKGLEFHQRVRQGFLDHIKTDPMRFHLLDGKACLEENLRLILKDFFENI